VDPVLNFPGRRNYFRFGKDSRTEYRGTVDVSYTKDINADMCKTGACEIRQDFESPGDNRPGLAGKIRAICHMCYHSNKGAFGTVALKDKKTFF